jgi:hypothetical protein
MRYIEVKGFLTIECEIIRLPAKKSPGRKGIGGKKHE